MAINTHMAACCVLCGNQYSILTGVWHVVQALLETYTFKFAVEGDGVALLKDNTPLLDIPPYDPDHTKRSIMLLLRSVHGSLCAWG